MYIAVFNYEVAPEQQEQYLQVTREVIKPFWLSHGTYSYDVYQRYLPETGQPDTEFMKTQIVDGMPLTPQEARASYPPGSRAIIDTFYSFARNVSFKPYLKKI